MSRRFKVVVIALLIVTSWACIAPWLASRLIVERPLANADAIIVLSGSAVYKERTRKAAELYKEGVAPRIMITDDGEHGGWSQSEKKNLLFVEFEQRELIANGVMPDAIMILPGQVSGTDDEARAFESEIAARPVNSVLIVTSAYHTRRALRTFEKILAGKNVEIGIVYSPTGDQTPDPNYWWIKPRGWQMVAEEYVKLVVYWAYY